MEIARLSQDCQMRGAGGPIFGTRASPDHSPTTGTYSTRTSTTRPRVHRIASDQSRDGSASPTLSRRRTNGRDPTQGERRQIPPDVPYFAHVEREDLDASASLLLAAATVTPQAQTDPTIGSVRATLDLVKGYITKAADQVPEEMYAFKPTADVRSMGQLFGHIADANFMICSAATGMKPEMQGIEKSKTTKADLKAALDASFTFCEAGFDKMTAATGAETVKFSLPGTVLAPWRDGVQHGAQLRALRESGDLHAGSRDWSRRRARRGKSRLHRHIVIVDRRAVLSVSRSTNAWTCPSTRDGSIRSKWLVPASATIAPSS